MSRRLVAVAAEEKTKEEILVTQGNDDHDDVEDENFQEQVEKPQKTTKKTLGKFSAKRGAGGGICLSDEDEEDNEVQREESKASNLAVAAKNLKDPENNDDSPKTVSMGALLARMNRPKKKAKVGGKRKIDRSLALMLAEPSLDKSQKGIAAKAAKAALAQAGKMQVTEQVRFAGQSVDVIRTMDKSSSDAKDALAAAAQVNKPVSTLDKIVDELKNPAKAISAVEKSSYDWDKFKSEQGLEEQLANASKDGYVEKQQFLERVDRRRFEAEVAERERARAMAALNAPKPK